VHKVYSSLAVFERAQVVRGAYELAERVRRNPADGDALTELALNLDRHARAHAELAPLVEQALDWLELDEGLGDEPDDGLGDELEDEVMGMEPQACRALPTWRRWSLHNHPSSKQLSEASLACAAQLCQLAQQGLRSDKRSPHAAQLC